MPPAAPAVLVVDDDRAVLEVLGELLSASGYNVLAARNGREGLDQLRKTKEQVGLILLDLTMPVLDGVGFRLEQIADPALAEIPVIVLTATALNAEQRAALQNVRFLRKPVKPNDLLRVVQLACW